MNQKLHQQMEECKYKKEFLEDGNFTACLLLNKGGHIISFGFAKCNPNCDDYENGMGREIALARAVKKLPTKKYK